MTAKQKLADDIVVAVKKENQSPVYVPIPQQEYVKWGHFETVKKIIQAGSFFPTWLSGEAGNGKTVMIEQACADLGRKFVRVNFTNETDEHDLIGGFRIQDGNTVYQDGPVTSALREGAVLLLDEVDAGGSNKMLVLQSVLEGRGVLIKATGEIVQPAPGFTVFATSNTKGRGSDDGRYIGTNIMNGAFLDRFAGMLHQDYPPIEIEKHILQNYFSTSVWKNKAVEDISDEEATRSAKFIVKLTKWSGMVREAFNNGVDVEVITTRSLINIVRSFAIFQDEKLAIQMICSRYSDDVSSALVEYYDKINDDGSVVEEPVVEEKEDDMIQIIP